MCSLLSRSPLLHFMIPPPGRGKDGQPLAGQVSQSTSSGIFSSLIDCPGGFFSCFCLYVVLVKFAIGVHLLLPRRSWTTSTASRTGSGSMLIQGYLGLHQFHLLYVPLSHLSNRVYSIQIHKDVSSGFRLPSVLTR